MLTFRFGDYDIYIESANVGDVLSPVRGRSVLDLSDEFQPSAQIEVTVKDRDDIFKSARILAAGGAAGLHPRSCLLEGDRVVLCAGSFLVSLKLPSLELDWKLAADSAVCVGVYSIPNAYIVHGELAISRISRDGRVEWSHVGRDIFTNLKEGPGFAIGDGEIRVEDWSGEEYRFSYDGDLLTASPKRR